MVSKVYLMVLSVCLSLPSWGVVFGQTPSFLIEWEFVWGSAENEDAKAVCPCPGGGYLLVGRTNFVEAVGGDLQVVRITSDRRVLWDRIYEGREITLGKSTVAAADVGYVIAGQVRSPDSDKSHANLLKISEDGAPIWDRLLGDAEPSVAYSARRTSDGGYIVAGIVVPGGSTKGDAYLVKTDSEGHVSWVRNHGGPEHDYALFARETSDGGYAFAGQARSFQPVGSYDVYVGKTDARGELVWQRLFGGMESELAHYLEETRDGGLVVVAYTKSFSASLRYVYLIRIDASGDLVWEKTFGPEGSNYGFHVEERPDGGFTVAGGTSGDGDRHYEYPYLILTDRDGNLLRERFFPGEFPIGNITGATLTPDGGAVFVGAVRQGPALSSDFHAVRIVLDPDVAEPRFLRGDANDDGAVDVSDAVTTLEALFLGTKEIPCQDSADSNDDELVDVSDPINTLGFLFLGQGEEIPAPGPNVCGPDPAEGALTCAEYSADCP